MRSALGKNRPKNMTDSQLKDWMLSVGIRQANGCLVWPMRKFETTGYGCITYLGNNTSVHRLMYALLNNKHVYDLPSSLHVCHDCNNPPCYEPTHLFRGNASMNALDAFADGLRQPMKGMANPQCKLSDTQVRELVAKFRRGISAANLALEYGISKNHVWVLNRGDKRGECLT